MVTIGLRRTHILLLLLLRIFKSNDEKIERDVSSIILPEEWAR